MVYLAKFLTVVMHAGFSGDNRHNLVERAKQSFLRDMQVVIVEGGPNNGKLVDHKFDNANTTSSSKKAKHPDEFFQDFNSQKSFVEYWNSSWGYGTDSLGVISHRNAHGKHRKLFTVTYPDNPGCTVGPVQLSRKHKVSPADLKKECDKQPVSQPSYVRLSKYYGAQKPVVGIWIANKTFPDTAWTMVMDDDNAMIPSRVADWLVGLDPDVPLLLTGLVGPVATHIKCHARVNQTNWGCCTDPRYPCRSYVKGHKQSIWSWNKDKQTFEVTKQCADNQLSSECCKAEPWPEGEKYRYPFKASATGTSFSPHFTNLYPFGGFGYVLSRGLLNSIDSDYWTHCMFALQCANADHRVMTCVLNAGYMPTFIGAIPTLKHHVREPKSSCHSRYTFEREPEEGKLIFKNVCLTKAECDLEAESDAWSATRVSFGNASNSSELIKLFGNIPINATNQLVKGNNGSISGEHGSSSERDMASNKGHSTEEALKQGRLNVDPRTYMDPYTIDGKEYAIEAKNKALMKLLESKGLPPWQLEQTLHVLKSTHTPEASSEISPVVDTQPHNTALTSQNLIDEQETQFEQRTESVLSPETVATKKSLNSKSKDTKFKKVNNQLEVDLEKSQLGIGIITENDSHHHYHHGHKSQKGDSTATTEASPTHSQHHADHSVLKFNLPAAT